MDRIPADRSKPTTRVDFSKPVLPHKKRGLNAKPAVRPTDDDSDTGGSNDEMSQREKSYDEDRRRARARETAPTVSQQSKKPTKKARSIMDTWRPNIFDEPADTQDEPEF